MKLEDMSATATALLTAFGLKVIGAIVALAVGRWLIRLSIRLVQAALRRHGIDPLLERYAGTALDVALSVVLVVAILGFFGVETTSFAALVAALGIAIGAAWSGVLANFAGGVFLVALRPFKAGDHVKVAGVEGTVRDIGLFATTLVQGDNVVAFIGNAKILGDTVINWSAHPYRRVDRTAQLAHSVDVSDAVRRLKDAIARIPNTLPDPAPEVEVLEFTTRGPVLAARAFAPDGHYWQVYFDINRAIVDTFGEAGYPVPEDPVLMRHPA